METSGCYNRSTLRLEIPQQQNHQRMLRNFIGGKRYTPFHVRKQIAESLIFSKLDCSNILFDNVPTHVKNGLRKAGNATVSFVLNKCTKIKDVLGL